MSRALLYSREGLFSLKGGSGLREVDLLFHKEPSPIDASAICCLPPAQSSPFSPSVSFLLQTGREQGQIDHEFLSAWQALPDPALKTLSPFLLYSPLSEHSVPLPCSLTLSYSFVCKKKSPEGLFFPKLPFYFSPTPSSCVSFNCFPLSLCE